MVVSCVEQEAGALLQERLGEGTQADMLLSDMNAHPVQVKLQCSRLVRTHYLVQSCAFPSPLNQFLVACVLAQLGRTQKLNVNAHLQAGG